jgi:hypothetical protein
LSRPRKSPGKITRSGWRSSVHMMFTKSKGARSSLVRPRTALRPACGCIRCISRLHGLSVDFSQHGNVLGLTSAAKSEASQIAMAGCVQGRTRNLYMNLLLAAQGGQQILFHRNPDAHLRLDTDCGFVLMMRVLHVLGHVCDEPTGLRQMVFDKKPCISPSCQGGQTLRCLALIDWASLLPAPK